MKRRINLVVLFALSLPIVVQADTVRLELGGLTEGNLQAWLTLSGANIESGADQLRFDELESVAFQADFGEGIVDFDVQLGPPPADILHATPDGMTRIGDHYTLYSMWFDLTETVTNPGVVSQWRFQQGESASPGVDDDSFYVSLINNSASVAYGESLYSPAIWTEVTAVPVPAAAWLFGSALAGLGWLRRARA